MTIKYGLLNRFRLFLDRWVSSRSFFKNLCSNNFNIKNSNNLISYVLSFSIHKFVDSISRKVLSSSLEKIVELTLKIILIFKVKIYISFERQRKRW